MRNIVQFFKKKFFVIKGKTMDDVIKKVLTDLNYNYSFLKIDEEENVLKLDITLDYGKVDSYIINNKRQKYIEIRNSCSIIIPELKRKEIAEYITRINNQIVVGKFDLNMENGDLTFGIGSLYDDALPQSESVFKDLLLFPFHIMEKNVPSIMKVIYAETTAKKEFFHIQNKIDPSWN